MKMQPPGLPSLSSSDLAKLAQLLRPWFLPSSLGTAPLALGSSGNRSVVSLNRPPQDQTALALIAGTVTWTFSTKFKNPPLVSMTPVGTPPTSGGIPASLFIQSIGPNSVIIASTINTDTRTLHLTAAGNPN